MKEFIRRELWVSGDEDLALQRMATGFGVSVETYLHMVVFNSHIPRPVVEALDPNSENS